jgi:hypothetical protein
MQFLILYVICFQDGSVPTVELCDCCHTKLLKNEAGELSIAKGNDFGNPKRLGLSPPTELERAILAVVRLYSSVVQLSAGVSKGRSAGKVLRGHFISFFQVRFLCELRFNYTRLCSLSPHTHRWYSYLISCCPCGPN